MRTSFNPNVTLQYAYNFIFTEQTAVPVMHHELHVPRFHSHFMEQHSTDSTMVFPDGTPSAHALIYILIYELQRDKKRRNKTTHTDSEYLNEQ